MKECVRQDWLLNSGFVPTSYSQRGFVDGRVVVLLWAYFPDNSVDVRVARVVVGARLDRYHAD